MNTNEIKEFRKVWSNPLRFSDTFVNLESVGSIIKLETKTIYPLQTNGNPDLKMGVLIDDVSDEWFVSLSDYDFGTISNFINNR